MVEDETALVFAHRHPYTQLHHHAGLAEARGNTWLHPPRPHLAEPLGRCGSRHRRRRRDHFEARLLGAAEPGGKDRRESTPACEALASELLIAYLGHKDAMVSNRLRLAQQALLDAAGQRQRLSAAGAELVDGQGVEPVVTLLIAD